MCMLSFIPGGIEIEEQDLLNGGIINGDGSGWAIAANDHIEMGKSMKVEEALEEFVEVRKKYPECDAMFHSRWATHGTTTVANVHPFLVGGSHKTVMAHNGILPCKPMKGDWRSDTRILADEYLNSRYRRFDKPRAMQALSDYIGKNNKLCILTVDDKYQKNSYLVNESSGNWDTVTGVWHSNYDYVGRAAKYPIASAGWSQSKNGVYTYRSPYYQDSNSCDFCGYGLIGKAGYCLECGTCDECAAFRAECNCYSHYYRSFDWDQESIARKALDCKVTTLGPKNARGGADNTESEAQG